MREVGEEEIERVGVGDDRVGLTEISSMKHLMCGMYSLMKALRYSIKLSLVLNSTRFAKFWMVLVTSFNVLSAMGLGKSTQLVISTWRKGVGVGYLSQCQIAVV